MVLLDQAVKKAAEENEKSLSADDAARVCPITSLAYVLTMGDAGRFQRGKRVASYLGLDSPGVQFGLAATSGYRAAGQSLHAHAVGRGSAGGVCYDPGFRNEYLHRCHQKLKAVAKVAAAGMLAVRLYWMLRTNTAYPEVGIESSSVGVLAAKRRPQD